jgi:peptidyl-prolyl cis-trans isomerase C
MGWHVIWLEDMRPARIPTLDELKPQLAQSLSQKKLQQFQDDLRSKAKIQ